MTDKGHNDRRRRIERPFWFYTSILLAAVALIGYLGFVFHANYRSTLVKQWVQQAGATLDLTAIRIENFYSKFSANLVTVSHNPVIRKRLCNIELDAASETNYCPLHDLYELHKNEINAILLLDTTGNVVRRFPEESGSSTLGQPCLSRIEVELKLKPDEVYVSESFENRRGTQSITISCPVYDNELLVGILRWMVTYDKMAYNSIELINMGFKGHLWLADEQGKIQYHQDSSLKGSVISDIFGQMGFRTFNEKGSLEEVSNPFENGPRNVAPAEFVYKLNGKEDELSLNRRIVMGNRQWVLFLSMPLSSITKPVRQHAVTTFWMEVLVLLLITTFAYIFYLTQKRKTFLETEAKYLSQLASTAEQLNVERQNRLMAAIEGQETERNRIARELHDSLGQYLLAMKVKLQGILEDPAATERNKLEDVSLLSSHTIEEVKRISENLMPRMLDEFGLVAAARRLCEESARDNEIQVDFVSFGLPHEAEHKFKTHLYRIIQEALSNAIKHSQAKHIDIQLLGNQQQLSLLVQDDGVGFESSDLSIIRGNGLKNIIDRVRIMNGDFELDSNPGGGTSIRIRVGQQSWESSNENS